MCIVLGFKEEDYIKYILKDENLCFYPVGDTLDDVAISTVGRISMVIRCLLNSYNTQNADSWFDTVNNIIDSIEGANVKKEDHIKNLREYLRIYKNRYLRGKDASSFIEGISYELVMGWKKEFIKYSRDISLLSCSKKLYELNSQFNDYKKKYLFGIENCLYFKDYYYFDQD